MTKKLLLSLAVAAATLASAFVGCGGTSGGDNNGAVVSVTGVTLDPNALTLSVGGVGTLRANVQPSNATDKTVSWSSTAPAVAMVSSNGVVTALAPGSAVITVLTRDGSKLATCSVTVGARATGVALDKNAITLAVGATETLTATVHPENASNKGVIWTSSNSAVAAVPNGVFTTPIVVTAQAAGTATITARTQDGGFAATCSVIVGGVIPPGDIPVTGVTISQTTLSLTPGATFALTATVLPGNATNKSVTWSSSNIAAATVNTATGVVTAVAVGNTTITVKTVEGEFTATCSVTVGAAPPAVETVTLNMNAVTLIMGSEYNSVTLTATVLPSNADQAVTWSSNSSNVTLTPNGLSCLVTAASVGGATVTVRSAADPSKTADCLVTVAILYVPVTGLELDKGRLDLTTSGQTSSATLIATVEPSNATDKNVTWTSNNPAVATVSATGLVTALSKGEAKITAATRDDEFKAYCDVYVTVSVTGVTLNRTTESLMVGEVVMLYETVYPSNADDKTVTWSSSNEAVATVTNSTNPSVTNGIVTAIGPGTAIITVKTKDGDKTATCTVTVTRRTIHVKSVTLYPAAIEVARGGVETLEATVIPNNADSKALLWASSNNNVATVSSVSDNEALVTAIAPGTATITVTAADTAEGVLTATCVVLVNENVVHVTGLALVPTSATIGVGGSVRIMPIIEPSNATNKNVAWSTNRPDAATVTTDGDVDGIAAGEANITAAAHDRENDVDGYPATSTVNVIAGSIPVRGITLSEAMMTIGAGGRETLTATIAPANATNKNITWTTTNAAIARFLNTPEPEARMVTVAAGTAGTAIIRAAAEGGYYAECVITVIAPIVVENLTLDETSITIGRNGSKTLTATLYPLPPNAPTNKTILWESSNINIAVVNANGIVSGVNLGFATITATSAADSTKFATCQVEVTNPVPVQGVMLSKYSVTIAAGYTETLIATVLPSAPTPATNQALVWSSDNPGAAAVSASGVVYAQPDVTGMANITVRTVEGNFSATCYVQVIPGIVALNKNDMTISAGASEKLTATINPPINPPEAIDQAVTWTSSNPAVAAVTSSGLVMGQSKGAALITVAMNYGNSSAVCAVSVEEGTIPVIGVSLDEADITLAPGNTCTLIASVAPANANQAVTWTSSDTAIATVTNGVVTGVSGGTAIITATSVADPSKLASCRVSVTAAPVTFVSATANGMSETVSSTAITLTFGTPVTGLIASNIGITNGTGAAMLGTNLTGSGTSWTIDIASVTTPGAITITISNASYEFTPNSLSVTVYKAANSTPVTFVSAEANGSHGTVTSTNITLTFNTAVTGLALGNIGISGAAEKGTILTSSSGNTIWTISIENVTANSGNVTVTVNNFGSYVFDPNSRPVTVYKEATTPTQVTFTPTRLDGASGATSTTGITLTFSEPVSGLTANDITITNGTTGKAAKGALTGTGPSATWTIGVTVETEGDVSVSIANFGTSPTYTVANNPQSLTVYKSAAVPEPVTSVSGVASTADVTMGDATGVTLTATVNPGTANQNVTWSVTTGSGVVDITPSGNSVTVKAAAGATDGQTATVRATSVGMNSGGSAETADCAVTVRYAPVASVSVPTAESVTMGDATGITLTATVNPGTANQNVTWSVTTGSGVVDITPSGNSVTVKAAAGATDGQTATVRATSVGMNSGGSAETADCVVTVKYAPVTGVSLDTNTASVTIDDPAGITLTATVNPGTANQNVTWSIEPSGLFVLAGSGNTATITAVSGSVNSTDLATVTVTTVGLNGSGVAMTANCTVTAEEP